LGADMNLRWLAFDYVGPNALLTRKQRSAVRARTFHLAMSPLTPRPKVHWIVPIAVALAPGVLSFTPIFIWMQLQPPVSFYLAPAALISSILMLWIGMSWLGQFTFKRLVPHALRDLGYRVCGECSYPLHNLGEKDI